jgi:geranylgeranyl pyrophosphate synthase
MNLNTFFETAKADLERRLKSTIKKYEQKEKLEYFLNHGKRLRPLLSLLVFRACGGNEGNYQSALDLAVAIELQHSASLVHDDILDGDRKRRNKLSYYNKFGIEDAILTGHKAIVLGFKNVLAFEPRIIETLFDVWHKSLEGEIKDFESRKNPMAFLASGEDQYLETIVNKTASLFAGAAKIGSQKAGVSQDLENLFWEYGMRIGIGYQLADDSKDFNDGHGNLEVLPIPWIIKKLDKRTTEPFAYGLKDGLSPSQVLSLFNIDTRSLFNEEITKIRRAAEKLARSSIIPESEFKPLLADAPRYIIDRCLET